jgi:hypothetical protein
MAVFFYGAQGVIGTRNVQSSFSIRRISVGAFVMEKGQGKDYRRQASEAAARVDWCEKKLSYERKRHKALKALAVNDDWLDGKINPVTKSEYIRQER